jgi:7-keto-8-aminopelargonate synthetase-like enzyme
MGMGIQKMRDDVFRVSGKSQTFYAAGPKRLIMADAAGGIHALPRFFGASARYDFAHPGLYRERLAPYTVVVADSALRTIEAIKERIERVLAESTRFTASETGSLECASAALLIVWIHLWSQSLFQH